MPTMQQRVGNRYWPVITGTDRDAMQASGQDITQPIIQEGGPWVRVEGSEARSGSDNSTTAQTAVTRAWKGQFGWDALLRRSDEGDKLIGALTLHQGRMSSDVTSPHGNGKSETEGTGLGATLTWLQNDGVYVDSQLAGTHFRSDLSSSTADRWLTRDNKGRGWAASVELGKKLPRASEDDKEATQTITPQVQLAYSRATFDGFTDPFGASVSADKAESLRGRAGLAFNRDRHWLDEMGKVRRTHFYGIGNMFYEFLNSNTQVRLADVLLSNRAPRFWLGLGAGGSYNWNNDLYSVYGEVGADTAVGGGSGSNTVLRGTIGFRLKW